MPIQLAFDTRNLRGAAIEVMRLAKDKGVTRTHVSGQSVLERYELTEIDQSIRFLERQAVILTDKFIAKDGEMPLTTAHAVDVGTAYSSIQVVVQTRPRAFDPTLKIAPDEQPLLIALFMKYLEANE